MDSNRQGSRFRLLSIDKDPLHVVPYRYPASGGGVTVGQFPIYGALAHGLQADIDGLLVTSDLQGMELSVGRNGSARVRSEPARLIGHAIAEDVFLMSGSETVPAAERIGVVLAGDLHVSADLKKRGGKGDVRDVWLTFRSYFRWVAGVAGNHDRFGNGRDDLNEFAALDHIHYLDGDTVTIDSMAIGGVGGIIGNPRKLFRREEDVYLDLVGSVVRQNPALTVLHESPAIDEVPYPGSSALRHCLQDLSPVFVVSGHCHWDFPGFRELENGTQVLNVEGRAVLLRRAK